MATTAPILIYPWIKKIKKTNFGRFFSHYKGHNPAKGICMKDNLVHDIGTGGEPIHGFLNGLKLKF